MNGTQDLSWEALVDRIGKGIQVMKFMGVALHEISLASPEVYLASPIGAVG